MFRTQIVPLDGSQEAERALPYAVHLALASGGRLALVRVALGPPDSAAAKRFAARSGGRAPSPNLRVGDPAPAIVMAEIDCRADLVVMSTHGRTGLGRAVMGSVAGEVLRSGRVPVALAGRSAALPLARPARASAASA